jgi:hypothetical protein
MIEYQYIILKARKSLLVQEQKWRFSLHYFLNDAIKSFYHITKKE